MTMRKRIAMLTLTLAVVTSNANCQAMARPPGDAEIRRILTDRIDRYKQSVGIVVGVIEPAGRRLIAYGQLNQNDSRPLNGDTVFEIGSVTKVFTSLLLADMVKRGEVSLDDPVEKYLPAAKLPERKGKKITLVDLATHTAGLPREASNFKPVWEDWERDYSIEKLYEFLRGYELKEDIGSHYEYSNLGAALLGIALTRRAGMDYEALVRERITGPLGMRSTGVTVSPEIATRLAAGHGYMQSPAPNFDTRVFAAAGALRSTANDLLTLLSAVMGYTETPLAPAMASMLDVRRSRVPRAARLVAGGVDVHLAWHAEMVKGVRVIWHNGGTLGYKSFVGYDPVSRTGVVVLSNSTSGPGIDDIGMHLLSPKASLYSSKDLRPPRERREVAVEGSVLDGYVGRYEFAPGDWIAVTRDGGQLLLDGNEDPQDRYYPESTVQFFSKTADGQVVFKTKAGRVTEFEWSGNGKTKRYKRVP